MKIPLFPRVFLPASPPILYLFVLVFALNYGIIIKKFVVFATPPVHFRFLVSVAYLLLMVWRFSVLLALFSFYYASPPSLLIFASLLPLQRMDFVVIRAKRYLLTIFFLSRRTDNRTLQNTFSSNGFHKLFSWCLFSPTFFLSTLLFLSTRLPTLPQLSFGVLEKSVYEW